MKDEGSSSTTEPKKQREGESRQDGGGGMHSRQSSRGLNLGKKKDLEGCYCGVTSKHSSKIQKRTFRTVRTDGRHGRIRGDTRWVRVLFDKNDDPYVPDSEEEDEEELELTAGQDKQVDAIAEEQVAVAADVQVVVAGVRVAAVGSEQHTVIDVERIDREALMILLCKGMLATCGRSNVAGLLPILFDLTSTGAGASASSCPLGSSNSQSNTTST